VCVRSCGAHRVRLCTVCDLVSHVTEFSQEKSPSIHLRFSPLSMPRSSPDPVNYMESRSSVNSNLTLNPQRNVPGGEGVVVASRISLKFIKYMCGGAESATSCFAQESMVRAKNGSWVWS